MKRSLERWLKYCYYKIPRALVDEKIPRALVEILLLKDP